jgi:hypothetical protein
MASVACASIRHTCVEGRHNRGTVHGCIGNATIGRTGILGRNDGCAVDGNGLTSVVTRYAARITGVYAAPAIELHRRAVNGLRRVVWVVVCAAGQEPHGRRREACADGKHSGATQPRR